MADLLVCCNTHILGMIWLVYTVIRDISNTCPYSNIYWPVSLSSSNKYPLELLVIHIGYKTTHKSVEWRFWYNHPFCRTSRLSFIDCLAGLLKIPYRYQSSVHRTTKQCPPQFGHNDFKFRKWGPPVYLVIAACSEHSILALCSTLKPACPMRRENEMIWPACCCV